MMNNRDLTFHGLAIKRHSTAAVIAEHIGLPAPDVEDILREAVQSGRAVFARDAYTINALARLSLEARYSRYFLELRSDAAFVQPYEQFELINKNLKQVITDWQTIDVGGSKVPNEHNDKDYDADIIDRLGAVHEQVETILQRLAQKIPRLAVYERKLLKALELVEDGEIEWVSDIRRESYHTVWFELHEDLLRIMGRQREE
ncbi:MAG: hypothetical protein AB7U63_00665 [Porticoccaceae bacterium]